MRVNNFIWVSDYIKIMRRDSNIQKETSISDHTYKTSTNLKALSVILIYTTL